MHALMHMDWHFRLAMGLLAWPVVIALAVVLASAADPHAASNPWAVAVVSAAEVIAAAVAVVFPIWSLVAWAGQDDTRGTPRP
jgi:hypothetical protein